MRLLASAAVTAAAISCAIPLAVTPAAAEVVVTIDKSAQRMSVSVDGAPQHHWPISTGRRPYGTPSGVYRPQMLARRWFSSKYYNSPMPYSIFFHRGYAIHGTYYISRLGGPAAHGCVRLHPANAATLFAIVQRQGMGNTRIVVR
jgi:lipoprotein-anchoring transpeptidase ErfK/SrfK